MAAGFSMTTFAFLPTFGPMEMLIVGAIAVLLFGNRLPSVMKSLGQSVMEFKKGVGSIETELRSATSERAWTPPSSTVDIDDRDEPSAPKFEPPPSDSEGASDSGSPNVDSTSNVEST